MARLMTRLALVAWALLVALPVGAAQDFSGKWSGAFVITAPEQNDDFIYLNLTQKGKELTGTAGPNAERQWPLKGTVDGTTLTFEVQSDGPLVKFVLTYADGHLKGDASAERDGMKFAAKVDAQRVKMPF